jgi:hypothetical protein
VLGVVNPIALNSGVAHGFVARGQECVSHGTPYGEDIGALGEVLQGTEFVGDLGSAQQAQQRPLGLQYRAEMLDFVEHEVARGGASDVSHHARCRCVGAVGGPEGVVHVEFGQGSEGAGKFGLILGFAPMKSKVLQQQDFTLAQILGGARSGLAQTVLGECHGHATFLRESGGQGCEGEGIYPFALRPPEMRCEDYSSTGRAQAFDAAHRSFQPSVIDDSA